MSTCNELLIVQNLFVGKTPDALPDENDADSYTAITLGTILEYDGSANTYTDVTSSPPAYIAAPEYAIDTCNGILREVSS